VATVDGPDSRRRIAAAHSSTNRIRSAGSFLAAFGLIAAGLAGCTSDAPERPAAGEIKVGLVAPLTGNDAETGADAERGAQLAVDIINSDVADLGLPLGPGKGLPKLGGSKLTLVPADTASNADQAVAKAVGMITTDGVNAFVTADSAEVTAAVAQRIERVRIPSVDGSSSAGFLTSLGLDSYFRTAPADRDLGTSAFSLLRASSPGQRRIAIISSADVTAATLVPALRDLAAEAGYEVVAIAEFAPGGDAANAAKAVRTANPNAVLAVADKASDAADAVREIQTRGAALPIIGLGAGFLAKDFVTTLGAPGEKLFRVTPWSAELAVRQPISKAILDRYQERYNAPMSLVAAGSFTATLTLAAAINDAGAYEPDKIRVALLGTRLSGSRTIMPWDGVQFRENGQNVLASGAVEQLAAGKFNVVYPRELASAPVAWPVAARSG
jgi:branched-chain amino acid transport system substrate-binding protein